MIQLTPKTIQRLVVLINEETTYRSGPMLVALFNEVGFRDVYGRGFPSRGTFTEEHLKQINGREELERIIRRVFNPREFSECPEKFTACVDSFNAELKFDGWNIYWDEGLNDISFRRVRPADAMSSIARHKIVNETEDDFLKKEFKDLTFDGLISIPSVQTIVEARLVELKHCLDVNAPLSAIFLTGSILEAVLLSVSTANASLFCSATSAPKDKYGNVIQIPKWRLESLINVAKELGFLKEDVHRFCHVVRDFRNYIHPFEQNARGFSPDINTAKICLQVLKGAIAQVHEKLKEVSR
jgi:hypothetical protein